MPTIQNSRKKNCAVNQNYLQKLSDILAGKKVKIEDYKLARKQVYVSSANLSAAFQRMLSEPKSKQKKSKEVNKFIVLNHILSSFIATAASNLITGKSQVYPPELQRTIKRSTAVLMEANKKLEPIPSGYLSYYATPETEPVVPNATNLDEALLKSQLEFIHKISTDIRKITESIVA